MNDNYLKISEVANQLRVKDETVRRWIRSKKLKGTKINGHYLVSGNQLAQFTLNNFANEVGITLEALKEIMNEQNDPDKTEKK